MQLAGDAPAEKESTKMSRHGFTLRDTGFTVVFENGYGLSVQWSSHHMCSLYATNLAQDVDPVAYNQHSRTAECCEVTPSGMGKVYAHCAPEHVLKLLRKMERKQTEAEREMARQARIESLRGSDEYHTHVSKGPPRDDFEDDPIRKPRSVRR